MIFETRTLIFSNTALRKAFAWYQAAPNQTDMPHGVIASVTPKAGGAVSVALQQAGASRMREVAFPASRVLMVLLYFCRKQRVPIPRDADKSLDVSDDGLALTLRHNIETTGPR